MAEDSLIRSITFWRPAWEKYPDGEKIWVTRVNSYGKPMTYPEGIIFEGPNLRVTGDGTHSVTVQYVFEPPLSLPWRNGQFAFFVQDPCWTYVDPLVSHSNPYAGGRLWRTSRGSPDNCAIDYPPYGGGYDQYDMIFEVEFCRSGVTPVRRTSWGQVKVIYR